ncbi:S-layer homology domain-containing protein [Paenibacillus sp. LHD-117]|uniref:S-layer homology domain-containing protein n=1 Tax=Paenibacillus sp. LHD-117 TaxID=3071412 RepID=UPI0027DF8A4A|nr:S-layer homology domain-containing protein [Paenibacillus sp. LHD-117]MDQ6417918.1 S-layer homology domain-containing protein [Paenibacillus sp. LHD-117]
MKTITIRLMSLTIALLLIFQILPLKIGAISSLSAAANDISNASLSAKVGDLGQIEELYINNNPANRNGDPINFVLPNDTSPQNNVQHQWMGEMIFSYRTGDNEQFPDNRDGFVEVDTNKTLAAGGSTTYSNINPANPYFEKTAAADGKKVEVNFIGQNLDSSVQRAMKGFDVKSVFDMDTEDGSMLWEITLKNKSGKYIEFGDIGLPMPWNNKYRSVSDTYDNRLTVHNFAGADSGYSYAIRTSGEGNFMLFTSVPESGARIEYVDYWMQEAGEQRAGGTFTNWTGDSGGWFPGLNVLYIHSKDIQKTGRGYFTDASSLVLGPDEEKTYQFKFSAVRAGDNDPQDNAQSPNNASNSMEEREKNLRSILYRSGMIDAVALPGFQTAINMPAKLALHYDDSKIRVTSIDIRSVDENDPFDEAHIPNIKPGSQRSQMVNNSRTGRGLPDGNPGYTESYQFLETKLVDGEQHHIYSLQFGNLGNNSVRVDYELKVGNEWVNKFTQYEFNVMAELDETMRTHTEFMVEETQDKDPLSPTYGNYFDWYLTGGLDRDISHWGDDWGHDNINSITMKNYLDPNPDEIQSIERYLIDFMWERFMKHTQDSFTVANWLRDSGAFTDKDKPYTRAFSEIMAATGFFNMYRIQKAYPHLIEYRESPQYYLEKAYGIYYNRISSGAIGFYGEQQIPDMIEALKEEGMQTEYENLKRKFALDKGRNMTFAAYPYGSEFEYDNTGEEGAYAAAKALRAYYPENAQTAAAEKSMEMADWKTRAMRGIQPTWYHYSVPVFRGGEGWWNFQYTASLAGYIMDDWLRYQDDGRTAAQTAVAQQRNYAAKISNFNAINMGQISAQSVGSTSWRYSMYKGGTGTKNVFDGGTRVMNNGWNDFSGEADEGIYGSLLSISSDIVTDPVFGLFGYGALVTDQGSSYEITPKDGFGKRINLIDEQIYLVSQNEKIENAEIQKDGKLFQLTLSNLDKKEHASKITIDGAGLENGYYTIKLNNEAAGQFYVRNNRGVAMFQMSSEATAQLTIEKLNVGENQAPQITAETATPDPQALIPFMLNGIVSDDGAPDGTLTYEWEVVSTPEGGKLSFVNPQASITRAVGTREGSYTVRLTADDGQESASDELTFQLSAPPEKQAPQISEATAVQDVTNESIVILSGTAIPDPVHSAEFEPAMTYEWTVKQKPDGAGDIAFVDGDKATAYARVSKAGTYVFTFTAADEGKAASQDVTIVIEADADDAYRGISVVTQKDTAPTLQGQMNILFPDGFRESEIEWEEIDPGSYATIGSFEARGKVKDSDLEVRATVYVVNVQLQNVALTAKPSASFSGGDGYPEAMNNGVEPRSSRDFSPSRTAPNSAWHNWGREGDPSWVTYEWDQPFLASSMDVYVFQDGGGNFRPKDMQLGLRDENGTWYTPRALNGLGNELDRYNRTTFEPAYITGVRIDMRPTANGTGILEWKVYGYSGTVDKSELVGIYNYVNALNASNFIGEGLAPIAAAKANASAVIQNRDATEEEVAQALEKLLTDLKLLSPRDNNMAFSARVSASYTSPWERLAAVNDGRKTESNIPHWGTWGNAGPAEWVQYEWPQGATIESSNLVLWSDAGGILAPTKYEYSYIPMDSATNEWVTAGTITEGITLVNHTPVDSSNLFEFGTTLRVKALRVTMTKQSAGSGVGVGLWEWEATQPVAKQEQAAPDTSGWTITHANTDTGTMGKIEGVNGAMESRKLGDENYTPVIGASIENLEPGSYQIRYAATDELNASQPVTVEIRNEAKANREAPNADNLVVTPPTTRGGNDGKIENVTADMEYRKVDGGAYTPVSGTSIENLEAGSYEIRYAETDTENPSSAIEVVVPDPSEDTEAPTWVAGSTVTAHAGTTSVTLTWSANEVTDHVGVKAYKVTWIEGTVVKTHNVVGGNATSTVINGLQPSTTYTFKLEAGDAADNWSDNGPTVTVTTRSSYVPPVEPRPEPEQPVKPVDPEEPSEPEQPVEPEQPQVEFIDVPETHWAASAIKRAAALGIVQGFSDSTFKPAEPTTRAQFMMMLANAFKWQDEQDEQDEQGELAFTDNDEIGAWAKDAIALAVKRGVITGYADGSFRPDQEITRTEMIVILARVLELTSSSVEQTGFTDDSAIPAWGKAAAEALRELGLVTGRSNNNFAPNDAATRAEALVIILRVLDLG